MHPVVSLQFSRKFYIAQWFRDTTMETEKAIKSQKDEDSSEGTHHAKDVETTGQIMHRAESRKKFLRGIIKTAPFQFSTLKYVMLLLISLLTFIKASYLMLLAIFDKHVLIIALNLLQDEF